MTSPDTTNEPPSAYDTEEWWVHITDLMGELTVDHPEELDQSVLPAGLIQRLHQHLQRVE